MSNNNTPKKYLIIDASKILLTEYFEINYGKLDDGDKEFLELYKSCPELFFPPHFKYLYDKSNANKSFCSALEKSFTAEDAHISEIGESIFYGLNIGNGIEGVVKQIHRNPYESLEQERAALKKCLGQYEGISDKAFDNFMAASIKIGYGTDFPAATLKILSALSSTNFKIVLIAHTELHYLGKFISEALPNLTGSSKDMTTILTSGHQPDTQTLLNDYFAKNPLQDGDEITYSSSLKIEEKFLKEHPGISFQEFNNKNYELGILEKAIELSPEHGNDALHAATDMFNHAEADVAPDIA
jgi:hypothetical protein